MDIRFAKEKDIKQLVHLCKLHAEFEKSDFNSTGKEQLLSKYLFDTKDIVNCLVVKNQNTLVGYATFMKQFSTWDANFYIYLDCLYFTEKMRGKGLGTKLMQKIKEYAQEENCSMIQWQTPSFNKKAIGFYEKLGAISKSKKRFFWEFP